MDFKLQLLIERIKKIAEKNDTSLNQFLLKNNLPKYFVDNMKKGKVPNIETIFNFAEKSNCSVDYLLGRTNNPKLVDNITPIYRFPQYQQKAAAGVGILGRDSNYRMKEYVVNNIPDNAVYSMEISGNSMNSEKTNYLIHTGSIVLINPKFIESELENRIVIANFKGQIICKRYINKGNYILFQSDNSDFKEENRRSSDDPECRVLGIVLGVIEDNTFIDVN